MTFLIDQAKGVPTLLAPLVLLGVLGCEDPLKAAQSIEEPRVLGVRVATASDQSSLEPAQSAAVEVLLAGPEGTLDARLSYRFCEAADSDRGVPICQGSVFSEATLDLDGFPLAVDIPAAAQAGARLAFLGAACLQSEPQLSEDPLDWSCSGDEQPLRLSLDAWISAPGSVNANPDLSAVSVMIGGVSIPLDDPRAQASCSPDAPAIASNATHAVEVLLGDGARELGAGSQADPGESLQISHFSTRGLFERQYSFVAPEQDPQATLDWEAPEASSPVKQYLVVRDGRGGVSWVSWSVCAR